MANVTPLRKPAPLYACCPRLYRLFIGALGLTGMSQLPIFKRYYLADIPGLGWLDDFILTHQLHYLLAIPFLLLVGWRVGWWLVMHRPRLAPGRMAGAWIMAILIISGMLRVIKNLPALTLDANTIIALELVHLFAAMALGLYGLAMLFVHRSGRTAQHAPGRGSLDPVKGVN